MTTCLLVLYLLIFAATQGCRGEEEAQDSTSGEKLNCSDIQQLPHQEEITNLVREFNISGTWSPFRTGIEQLLNRSSSIYQQVQEIEHDEVMPLNYIAYGGMTELVTLLLCSGLPVDRLDNYFGYTMLVGASSGGHLGLVKMLLDQGADPNVKIYEDWTAVMSAAVQGYLDVVKTLVQAGADIEAKNSSGRTALDVARSTGKTEVVQYLEQLPH